MWNYVYVNYGYSHVIGWVFILAVIIFLFGTVAAILYSVALQKFVKRISNKLYDVLRNKYLREEKKLIEKY